MAFVVHDLKNPVNAMDLWAQLLVRDKGLSEQRAKPPRTFASRRAGIASGAKRDVDARRRELRADALQVGFTAAALRVPCVAPAQQQHRAQIRHWSTA